MSQGLDPLFGANIDPTYADPREPFQRTQLAEQLGFDLITIQDHPYNNRFLDTWTLLSALTMQTERIHLGTNVTNLPLRPPAMLAKMAASLDRLSGGRVELGLGAGGFWKAIEAMGGPGRTSKEAYQAFKDALYIIRGFWEEAEGGTLTYQGEVYGVKGMKPGPAPAHPIRIWVGGTGPSMMRLTGRLADGLLVSRNWVPPQRLEELNNLIDEGAAEAGRSPSEIRRGYNLMGIVDVGIPETTIRAERQEGFVYGAPREWVDEILDLYRNYRQDTFIFWPAGDGKHSQLEGFGHEVIPAVREALQGPAEP
ncbi:MAG: LLM class flavin-dependent oxidoreductase [Chloroflexota bacterium]|nr:LLM class flavin-dependent oxidoreductase [Chloroflexota bacterium]